MTTAVHISVTAETALYRDALRSVLWGAALTDGEARAIAAAFQSPSRGGAALAALASGVEVSAEDVMHNIAVARHRVTDPEDFRALGALADWTLDRATAPNGVSL